MFIAFAKRRVQSSDWFIQLCECKFISQPTPLNQNRKRTYLT